MTEYLGTSVEVEYLLLESATMDITQAVSEKITRPYFDIVMVVGGHFCTSSKVAGCLFVVICLLPIYIL